MKLTQANVARIMPEPGKFEGRVFDDELQGFGVRVWDPEKPKRIWIIQYRRRSSGKTTTYKLGRCERMSASVARDLARQKLAQAELGIDPGQEQQTARNHAAETFETIAARFLKTKESLRSHSQIETYLTKYWAPFNRQSIHAIARRDIAARLGEIAEQSGPYAANRARSALSTFFTWAMREGLLDELDSNPVVATNKYADEAPRARVLSDRELATIWHASNDDDYGNIIRLLILTGQRRGEVGGIARGEIDLAGRKWTIPGSRTKNKLTHEIPLSDPALAILKQAMRGGREDRSTLFGNGAAANGFRGYGHAKLRLDGRLAQARDLQESWRLHDIRRTVATRMADLGVLPHVIESALNHQSGHKAGVVGTYNRSLYSAEKARALDLWAAHVEAIVAGKPAANVTPLRRKARGRHE